MDEYAFDSEVSEELFRSILARFGFSLPRQVRRYAFPDKSDIGVEDRRDIYNRPFVYKTT